MKKILSIIIPTYNMDRYLGKCLDSLLVSDVELLNSLDVIVVNDGSNDNSSIIAHSYEMRYPNVFRVVDKTNGNYGSCINSGLPLAIGKYVKVLDSDDYFNTKEFELYLHKLIVADCDLIINDKTFVDSIGSTLSIQTVSLKNDGVLSFSDIASNWNAIDMHKIAYRTDMVREIGYRQSEGVSYSDLEWMIKPIVEVNSASNTGCNVYSYLQGRIGQTIDKRVRKASFRSIRVVVQSIGEYWKGYDGPSERKQFLFDYFVYCLINTYREHFFQVYFDKEEFMSFDRAMVSSFPDAMEIVDTHPWVSFIPKLCLVKEWRNKKKFLFWMHISVIRTYFALSSLKAVFNKENA